jgi:hypothetical protein
MRDSILTSLILASATLTSATPLQCFHTRSRELAVAASCGDEGSLSACFSNLPLSAQPEALSESLQQCFVSAGCTPAESQIEAAWALNQCNAPPSNDLRRGRRQPSPNNDIDDTIPLGAAAAGPLLGARNPLPAQITAMNLPRQNSADPTPTTDGPRGSPSPCFTDEVSSMETCPIETAGPNKGKKGPCTTVGVSIPKCREGLICKSDGRGNPSCMWKETSPGLAGIIIAVVFAAFIAVSVITICFLCCRERREHRRIERAAEAARIAKEAKTQATVAAKRPGVSVTGGVSGPAVEGQPLMYQGGGGAGGGSSSPGGGAQQGYQQQQPQGYGGANPFSDAQQDGHPLR